MTQKLIIMTELASFDHSWKSISLGKEKWQTSVVHTCWLVSWLNITKKWDTHWLHKQVRTTIPGSIPRQVMNTVLLSDFDWVYTFFVSRPTFYTGNSGETKVLGWQEKINKYSEYVPITSKYLRKPMEHW